MNTDNAQKELQIIQSYIDGKSVYCRFDMGGKFSEFRLITQENHKFDFQHFDYAVNVFIVCGEHAK